LVKGKEGILAGWICSGYGLKLESADLMMGRNTARVKEWKREGLRTRSGGTVSRLIQKKTIATGARAVFTLIRGGKRDMEDSSESSFATQQFFLQESSGEEVCTF